MDKRPFAVIPGKADNTYVYVFSYDGDENDFTADRAAYETELKKHLMVAQSPVIDEMGLGVTGTSLTISDDGGTGRTIELTLGNITAEIAHPLVLYKGEPIPYSLYDSVATSSGEITLVSGTTTTYGTDASDYVVYYSDHVLGILQSAEVGGVSLPIESSSYKAVGHVEPVVSTETRGDAEATGSLSMILSLTSIMFDGDTTPRNYAGDELFARIYGSDWTQNPDFNDRIRLNYNSKPFGICIVTKSGKPYSQGDPGYVWGSAYYIYHCQLTNIAPPSNISGDASDPILQTVEFRSKHPHPDYSAFLTS